MAERTKGGGETIRVTDLDGDEEEVSRHFDTFRVVPPEDHIFMSPPGQPDIAVPVEQDLRANHRRGGWEVAASSFTVPFHAEVDGQRLYVAGQPRGGERRYRRATDPPLAYRAQDVRGVAVEVPDPLGTAGAVLGITAGVAAVAAIVAGVVLVTSVDMGGMDFGNPLNGSTQGSGLQLAP